MILNVARVTWTTFEPFAKLIVPPLVGFSHKGNMGRVGVIGGSIDYCGAPYYAAVSALKVGADLSWVFCSEHASIPIKSYSPELMVTPFYDERNLFKDTGKESADALVDSSVHAVVSTLPRIHVLAVGPGLGRHPRVMEVVRQIMHSAANNAMPMVVDGDGLHLVSEDLSVVAGNQKCILTPNNREFERLAAAAMALCEDRIARDLQRSYHSHLLDLLRLEEDTGSGDGIGSNAVAAEAQRVYALSAVLGGVTIMRKGAVDIIASAREAGGNRGGDSGNAGRGETVFAVQAKGAPRRCGGLGDILTGVTAVALNWALQRSDQLRSLTEVTQNSAVDVTAVSYGIGADGSAQPAHHSQGVEDTTRNAAVHACVFASILAKQAAELAFAQKGRSMTAPDVVEQIGAAFRHLHPEG